MNWLRWGTIGGLILLHFVVDFFRPRFVFQASYNEKVEGIVLGICMAQLNLIAIWAALANGRWIVRLPWALLLTMLMWFGLSLGNRLHPESIFRQRFSTDSAIQLGAVLLGGVLVAQIPLWIARVVFRWRLKTRNAPVTIAERESQFGIAHLMWGMTFLAASLAVARIVFPPGEFRLQQFDWEQAVVLAVAATCNLVTTLPCIWGAFSRRTIAIAFAFGGSLYVVVVSTIETVVVMSFVGVRAADSFLPYCVLNLTQFYTVLGTLLLLRALGFEFVRRTRHTVPKAAPSLDKS